MCTIKSVSANPQTVTQHTNTQHTESVKSTFEMSINGWLQGYDVEAVFDYLKYKIGIQPA